MPTLVRPRIERRTPADLVVAARAGELRVPGFQRLYRWTPSDVVALFDSMYKGYPIGNLLLWQRSAEAQHVTLGPLEINAPAVSRCHWVVDGQQRITSIVGVLAAPEQISDPRFRIYFDLDSAEFRSVPAGADVARPWLPVRAIATNQALLAWQRDNADWLTQEHFDLADAVASAIREYEVPSYVVESQDERVLREIFARLNTTGRQMTEVEVFQALWSAAGEVEPHDLRSLADTVGQWGFGRLDDVVVMQALRAIRHVRFGGTPPDQVWSEFTSESELDSALVVTSSALNHVVDFLRAEAGIPHVRLLPLPPVVPILARFMDKAGPPQGHAAVLLRRWVWRVSLSWWNDDFGGFALGLLRSDATASALALLSLPAQPMAVLVRDLFEIDFDHSRTARLDVLGMLSLSPLDLVTGQPVAVAQLLDEGDPLCRPVIPLEFPALSAHLVHGPTEAPLRDLLLEATVEQLASHGVTLDARAKLAAGDIQGFLADRADVLKGVIAQHIDRMAEWGARDDIRARDLMRLGG